MLALFRTQTVRRVTSLTSGTVVAQVLSVGAAPLITRLYTPQEFGEFVAFMAVVAPLLLIACLRYEMAVVLPADEEHARGLVVLGAVIAGTAGTIVTVLGVLLASPIAHLVQAPALARWLPLAGALVTAQGFYLVGRMWSLRRQRFSVVRNALVVNSATQVVVQVWTGWLGLGVKGLIFGQVAGSLVGATWIVVATSQGSGTWRGVWHHIPNVARRYRAFPAYQTFGSILNAISQQWAALVASLFFGASVAGLMGLSSRVLNLPLALVGGAVGDVFMERGARDQRAGVSGTISLKLVRGLLLLALPGAVLGILIAPAVCAWAFGAQWRESGVYIQLLMPFFVARFAISPLARAFAIHERQRDGLLWQAGLAAAGLSGLAIGNWLGSVHAGIAAYGWLSAAMYIVMLKLCLGYSGLRLHHLWRMPSGIAATDAGSGT